MKTEIVKISDGDYKTPSKWKLIVNDEVEFEYYRGPAFRISKYRGNTPYDKKHFPYGERIQIPYTITIHADKVLREYTEAEPPSVEDILEAVKSDCSLVMYGQSFEEFCAELGYDTDSMKAKKIYDACVQNFLKCLRVGLLTVEDR